MRHVLPILLLLSVPSIAAPARVCVVGDSITAGFSPSTAGWTDPLAALNAGTNFGAKNVAHSGDQIASAQALYASECQGRGYTWVAFLIGTNNLPGGDSAASMWAGTRLMVDAARADTSGRDGGARVLLLGLLPRGTGASWSSGLGTRLLAYNALMEDYADGENIIYVDTYNALLEPASSPPTLAAAAGGATDGLHPNNAGQGMIAAAVQAAVVAKGGW